MVGLIIAVAVGAVVYWLGDATLESAFLTATNFLFWWYLIVSIIILVITGLVALGVTAFWSFLGSRAFGVAGGLLGAIGGGAVGLFIVALAVAGLAIRVVGAYLLHDSVALVDSTYVWDTVKVVIGIILVAIPLLLNSQSSSRKRNQD